MQHIQGISRHQLQMSSLEDKITVDNPVRFIEAFVNHIDAVKLGFQPKVLKTEGRPGFRPEVFLKLYLYGYLNGIRSSRRLERECFRNIEVQWLLEDLRPNYHSIADFRKDNPKALRAHNSKKANFNQKKIDKHKEYIESKTQEYLDQLEQNDIQENPIAIKNIQQKIERLKQNKIKYERLEEELKKSGEPQVSTTDSDARALLVQGKVVEVSYNIQAAVDDKHNLVVATHTINRNDKNALAAIAKEAKENLELETFTVLVDKGYHNGRELETCKENNITTIVAVPEQGKSNENGTQPDYFVSNFIYNKEQNTYTCPQGQTLTTTGRWHKKTGRTEESGYLFQKYRTPACKTCAIKDLCTSRKGGREIDRSQYATAVEENHQRYKENAQLYRKRQEINEHIFGTIKRKWGYNYTDLIGLEKVNGEHSLIMLVYNIKRSINILGVTDLIAKLQAWNTPYKRKAWLFIKTIYLKLFLASIFFGTNQNTSKYSFA